MTRYVPSTEHFFSFSFLIYSFCIKVFYICIIYFLTPPSFYWKSECFSFYKALVWVKNDFSQTQNKLEMYAQVLNSIHFVLRTSKLIGKNLHICVLLDIWLYFPLPMKSFWGENCRDLIFGTKIILASGDWNRELSLLQCTSLH